MDIAESCVQLAQMQVAHQSRFHRDNAHLDKLFMQRWQDLTAEREADEEGAIKSEQQQGDGDGNSESDSQSAARDGS